ncbi:Uncharacterised protein [Pseudomonas aeruginosa]|nr:Uncharacterised protein [Pseudomonas aeruginosa]
MQALAEHLQAAADPQQATAVAQVTEDRLVPATLAQRREVGAHALRAGQDDQVRRRQRLAGADEAQLDLGVQAQRIEIGVVADPRQHRHHHLQARPDLGRLARVDGVLRLQVQVADIGQHAEHRLAGARLQPVEAGLQQGDVAAEAIDDEALDPLPLRVGEQFQGADQVGEDPAAVDIGDQDHRAIHRFGEAHVGDVVGAQVDLRRRAGALHHHHPVGGGEPPMGSQHRFHRHALVVVVGGGVHAGHRAAMDDHLGADVGVRLEQHRVHVGVRRQPAGLGLDRLGAADLAAVGGDRAVQRHVLRLERHHRDAAPGQPAAQRGHQGALAGVRGGALDHQGPSAITHEQAP